jgi:hypothetical protein
MTGLQTRYGTIDINGTVVSKGTMTIGGGRFTGGADLTINIRGGATLLSDGPITVDLAGVTIKGGTFEANTVTNFGEIMTIDSDVTGGTFLAPPTTFESGFHFGESVAAGTHVVLSGLAMPQEVIIDKPLQFLAEIDGFDMGSPNTIDLPNTRFDKLTSETFADNHLELFQDKKLVADLNIAGDFTIANFTFAADSSGGTLIRFTHPAIAGLSDPSAPIVAVAASSSEGS